MADEQKPALTVIDPEQDLLDVEAFIAKLDENVERVKVESDDGKGVWKRLDEVTPVDVPILRKDGSPYRMCGKPGRKNAEQLPPQEEFYLRKQEALSNDTLFNLTQDDPGSDEIFNRALSALAEEQASIAFAREESERTYGDLKTTSTISNRRVQALNALITGFLKRKEQMSARSVDLKGPAFQAVFVFIVETFKRAMKDAKVDDDTITVSISRFSRLVGEEHWEKEAKVRMGRIG